MKNQYIADIGDYGKYGLLRYLLQNGLQLGINWYMTPDDGRSDGSHREYLNNAQYRVYDPILYDEMKCMAGLDDKTIEAVQSSRILDGAIFFSDVLATNDCHWRDRAEERDNWHQRALEQLKETQLIFADPDNGLSSRKKQGDKSSSKYVLPKEIEDYYNRGQDVVYYHHRPRKDPEGWMRDKNQILYYLPEAKLLGLSFNRWSCRTYIFVVHGEQYKSYRELLDSFLKTPWGTARVEGKTAFVPEPLTAKYSH